MRPERESIFAEVRSRIDGSAFAFLVDYHGLTVEQMTELRGQLKHVGSRMFIAKNTLTRLVMKDLGWMLPEASVCGPSAVVCGAGDPTETAKVLRAYHKERQKPTVKQGWLEKKPVTAADVAALADLPGRQAMLGIVVGTIAAPMTRLVGVLSQKAASVVYVLKAIEDKKRNQQQ
ncbi:MAG: 50S ribosomal protein L10 [Lentisphaerae bacterium]|nr:50S ribosomal protein L10 [Lentisphaerota bacterium]